MLKGKTIKKIIGYSSAVLVVLLVVLWFSINGIIRVVVNKEGTAALGVQTTLSSAALNIFGGHITLSGLNIANVPGYSDDTFLVMHSCTVNVNTGSLLTNTIKISDITIDGLQITLDQQGLTSNLNVIMDKLNNQSAANNSSSASSNSSGGRQLDVGRVLLTNTVVNYRFGSAPPIVIPLQQMEMDEPTNPDGRPLRIADLIGKITQQIVLTALNNAQIKQALGSGSQLFENGAHGAGTVLQGAGSAIGNLLNLNSSNNNNGANK
jgi:hypothetical protein